MGFCIGFLGFPVLRLLAIVFFPTNPQRRTKISIDRNSVSCESPEVHKRLTRIEENYDRLDTMLDELESKMRSDERLKAIDDSNADFEQAFGIKRKRKWRPAKSKTKRRSPGSANPQKPR